MKRMHRFFLRPHISIIPNNPFIKKFILAESLLWSSWNLMAPIFAVFVTQEVSGGDITAAATSISVYLIVRTGAEILSSKYVSTFSDQKKIKAIILGYILISLSMVGFALSESILSIYLFWALSGFAFGISTPAKLTLFSNSLDKNKETVEWGAYDSITLIAMAIATSIGGIIASSYGFRTLFFIAAGVCLLGIIPYINYKPKTLAR